MPYKQDSSPADQHAIQVFVSPEDRHHHVAQQVGDQPERRDGDHVERGYPEHVLHEDQGPVHPQHPLPGQLFGCPVYLENIVLEWEVGICKVKPNIDQSFTNFNFLLSVSTKWNKDLNSFGRVAEGK